MRYQISFVLALFVLLITFVPFQSSAYFTTSQRATKISDTLAMYTITYRFGIPQGDLYLPIKASRDASDDFSVMYTVREDGENVINEGTTAGIVLSNAEIVNGMYKVPAGFSKSFMLFVLLKTESDTPEKDYALKIDSLPFLQDTTEGEPLDNALTKAELSYYITDEIELNP